MNKTLALLLIVFGVMVSACSEPTEVKITPMQRDRYLKDFDIFSTIFGYMDRSNRVRVTSEEYDVRKEKTRSLWSQLFYEEVTWEGRVDTANFFKLGFISDCQVTLKMKTQSKFKARVRLRPECNEENEEKISFLQPGDRVRFTGNLLWFESNLMERKILVELVNVDFNEIPK